MVEETPLLGDELGKVETLEVPADMHAEPLFARTSPHEAFDIAAQGQARTAPVARRQQRHRYARQTGRALLVPGIIQRMKERSPRLARITVPLLSAGNW